MTRRADVPTSIVAASPPSPPPVLPAFPDTLGACADELYELRAARLDLEHRLDEMQARETQLREHLITELELQGATSVAGQLARVGLTQQQIGRVADWPSLQEHIVQTRDFSLLQRRLNDAACRERWEAGEAVPGVVPFVLTKVSVTKTR